MMDLETVKLKSKQVGGLFALTGVSVIIAWLCIYFDIILALPAFLASVFFIFILQNPPQASLKAVVISYISAAVFGFSAPMLINYILNATGMNLPFAHEIIEIVIAVFIVGLIMIISGAEHSPAIASLIWWIWGTKTATSYTGFIICLIIVIGLSAIVLGIRKKTGGGIEEFPEVKAPSGGGGLPKI